MKNGKKIFLVDFDITVSKTDSTDTLLENHNPELRDEIRRKYRNKEITMREFVKTGLESLKITKNEFLETLKKVKIDETFIDFINSGVLFKIVSAGTKLNISGTLINYGIHLADEDIISNNIDFEEDRITVTNPFLDKEEYYGVDKKGAVEKYQRQGYRVYFIGDGPSDYKAVEVADFSFIRTGTRAVNFCKENNIDFFEFNDFNEILEYVKE